MGPALHFLMVGLTRSLGNYHQLSKSSLHSLLPSPPNLSRSTTWVLVRQGYQRQNVQGRIGSTVSKSCGWAESPIWKRKSVSSAARLGFFPPVNFKRQSVLMSVHIRTPADDDTGNSSLLFPVQQGSGGTNRTPTPLICALRISRLLILNLVTCTPHETTPLYPMKPSSINKPSEETIHEIQPRGIIWRITGFSELIILEIYKSTQKLGISASNMDGFFKHIFPVNLTGRTARPQTCSAD